MNYASTNEANHHDNGFPVMTGDDIADMVCGKQEDKVSNELGTREHYEEYVRNCEDAGIMPVSWASWEIQYPQPVASAPASVERLEELAPELQRELLALEANPTRGIMSDCVAPFLFLGLIEMDCGSTKLTEPGSALVRDYQRRQAANVDDTFHAKLIAGASSVTPVYTPERIAALEAENARLQSELDAARKALKEIAYSKHCDYNVNGETSYDIGVTDGHRFCAVIAKKALQQVSK